MRTVIDPSQSERWPRLVYCLLELIGGLRTNVTTQINRFHFTFWFLVLLVAIAVGFFIMTVKPAAQPPLAVTNTQSGQNEPESAKSVPPGPN
jgi:hypothetical protein